MIKPREPIISLTKPDAKGNKLVRIRVSFNGRADLYPGVSVKDEQWDDDLKRVKHGCHVGATLYSTLNKRIADSLSFIQRYFDNAQQREDANACAEDLKKQFNALFKRSEKEKSSEFFLMLEEYITKHNADKGWSKKYYEQWVHLKEDLRSFRPNLKFSDLSDTVMMSYVKHLSERMADDKIKEYLKKLKEFVNYAKKRNIPIHPEYADFNPKLNKRKKIVAYLTPEEVQRIIALDYSNKPSLDRVRDMFIFQCCTSLRFSDMQALRKDNIRNNGGKEEVQLVTKKDKGLVWFELNDIALQIYNKYKGYHYKDNKLFHQISSTNYRKFLRAIGKDANISGEVTTTTFKLGERVETVRKRADLGSHDARRTFIVTSLNGGASSTEIALYTSHSEVEMMLPYLSISEEGKKRVNSIIVSAYSDNDTPAGSNKEK